jgi:hypothetical protein
MGYISSLSTWGFAKVCFWCMLAFFGGLFYGEGAPPQPKPRPVPMEIQPTRPSPATQPADLVTAELDANL